MTRQAHETRPWVKVRLVSENLTVLTKLTLLVDFPGTLLVMLTCIPRPLQLVSKLINPETKLFQRLFKLLYLFWMRNLINSDSTCAHFEKSFLIIEFLLTRRGITRALFGLRQLCFGADNLPRHKTEPTYT